MLTRVRNLFHHARRRFIYIPVAAVSIVGGLIFLNKKLEWQLDDGYIYLPKELINIDTLPPGLDHKASGFVDSCKQTLNDYRSTLRFWFQEWKFLKERTKKPHSLIFDLESLLQSPTAKPVFSSHHRIHVDTETIKSLEIEELILHLITRARRIPGLNERAAYYCSKTEAAFKADRRNRQNASVIGHHTTHDHLIDKDSVNFLEQYRSLYTEAILESLNSSREHALALLEAGVLVLFHRIEESTKNEKQQNQEESDNWISLWVSKCTAAISQFPDKPDTASVSAHLYYARWGLLLSRWYQMDKENLRLRLEATKSIYNLTHYHRLAKSVYILNSFDLSQTKQKSSSYCCDIIFVHGLKGGVLKTWRQSGSAQNLSDYTRCWPMSWLTSDLPRARILAVDYETSLSRWNSFPGETIGGSLKESADRIFQDLLEANVGRRPIIWVTHSMGGLLVKHILTTDDEYIDHDRRKVLEATKGVVFYSVPHRGSDMAVFSHNVQRIIATSGLVQELRQDNPLLDESNRRFYNIANNRSLPIISFFEGQPCRLISTPFEYKAFLVTKESADIGLGPLVELPEENHFSVCKPKNRQAISYAKLLEFAKSLHIC